MLDVRLLENGPRGSASRFPRASEAIRVDLRAGGRGAGQRHSLHQALQCIE